MGVRWVTPNNEQLVEGHLLTYLKRRINFIIKTVTILKTLLSIIIVLRSTDNNHI